MVFTGLVQAVGIVQTNVPYVSFQELNISVVDRPSFWKNVHIGDSIAIDGVCLTVDSLDEERQTTTFRVSTETLSKTHISGYIPQSTRVNVECALRFGQPVGGHVVSGHVHTTTRVMDVIIHDVNGENNNERDIWFALPIEFRNHVAFKESICVNGVSLTVAEVDILMLRFRVSLIRQTVENTTLKDCIRDQLVNIEFNQHADPTPPDDQFFMRMAITEGEKGRCTTAPNPWVGCVIVDEDGLTVLGRGHHVKAGGEHAETRAIANAQENGHAHKLKNATLYVTLEPCHHVGRQPPCDQLIVKHGFKQVVVGMLDPDTRTNGDGCAYLSRHQINVVRGVCESEIRESLRSYVQSKQTGLPFVIAKLALTVDGCFTRTSTGEPSWITNANARQHAHAHLRTTSQAIIVGSRTVLKDNPRLMSGSVHQPLRIVIDSGGVCSRDDLHVLNEQDVAPTVMITTHSKSTEQARAEWMKKGVNYAVQQGTADGKVDLRSLLQLLSTTYGVLQVLIEGGAELQSAFLQQGLINEYWIYRSCSIVSQVGRSWASTLQTGISSLSASSSFKLLHSQTMEDNDSVLQRFQVAYETNQQLRKVQNEKQTQKEPMVFDTFSHALECFRRGDIIIVMDDESRENEGDLIVRADMVQEHQLALMRRHGTGIICVTMNEERAKALELNPMVNPDASSDPHQTAFTVTCDAISTSTGVSAKDRCETIRVLATKQPNPRLLRRPGHMFPLIARKGGLLTRRGHTEASVDMCKLANAELHVGVITELNNDDGSMMRYEDCLAFSKQFKLPIIHINQIVEALKQSASLDLMEANIPSSPSVRCLAECTLHLNSVVDKNVHFRFATFESTHFPQMPHRVLIKEARDPNANVPIMVRVHSECFTGDVLGSSLCDCGEQLQKAIQQIAAHAGCGIIVLPPCHEGRGIGLTNKILAYKLMQDSNGTIDTYEANKKLGYHEDSRTYEEAISVVQEIVSQKQRSHEKEPNAIILLTSNPLKIDAFARHGFHVVVQPILCVPSPHNGKYLTAKAQKHQIIHHDEAELQPQQPQQSVNPSHPGTFYGTHSSNSCNIDLSQKKICVIQAGWHKSVSDVFLSLLRKQLDNRGITLPWKHMVVPGSFEIPWALSREMKKQVFDCYIVVGAVMKGETMHFEMISSAITNKLMDLQVEYDRPVLDCVIPVLNQTQMEDRFLGRTDMHTTIAASVREVLCGPSEQ